MKRMVTVSITLVSTLLIVSLLLDNLMGIFMVCIIGCLFINELKGHDSHRR